MLITLFVEASNEEKAAKFLSSFVELTKNLNINVSVVKTEEYWKIDKMYKIELKTDDLSENQLRKFLSQIASKWMELPDELLASKEMEDCVIHLENLNMINLHFDY